MECSCCLCNNTLPLHHTSTPHLTSHTKNNSTHYTPIHFVPQPVGLTATPRGRSSRGLSWTECPLDAKVDTRVGLPTFLTLLYMYLSNHPPIHVPTDPYYLPFILLFSVFRPFLMIILFLFTLCPLFLSIFVPCLQEFFQWRWKKR